uniref:Uncharacterized protein n=1 Tax=Pseudictyota dubia TaxID=2749911 RepID=A0A7R9WGD0_9STRA|mmetsp:Transcript_47757/g.88586  ORF Transcript_47757/g.88586 Transcript_47757/m.88586 type:complete len:142 (+) Transcript_47757:187-612(+)
MKKAASIVATLFATLSSTGAYVNTPQSLESRLKCSSLSPLQMAPGGWGIGPSKEIQDEEFANRGGNARGYDAYELQNQGQFMRRVREERTGLKQKKANELLEIAKMAGILDKKKMDERGERLDKFDADDMDDDDDLDVSVQ